MTQLPDGTVVKSVKQLSVGNEICISVSDGRIAATVVDTKENIQ